MREWCSGVRLSVLALVLCSVVLTFNARSTVVSDSTYAATRKRSISAPVVLPRPTAAASFPPPPPSPLPEEIVIAKAASTQQQQQQQPQQQQNVPKSVGRTATPGEQSHGWRRTLPPHLASTAVWFEHERTLAEIFVDVPAGGIVWLTFANTAFADFAVNWAAHVYRLQKERHMAIAALDQDFQRRLVGEGLPYFGYDHGRTGDLRSSVTEFRRLGALKGALVLQVLRAERHVLLSDVDVIWMADPTSVLAGLAVHADVMSATDCLHVTGDEAKFPVTAQVSRMRASPHLHTSPAHLTSTPRLTSTLRHTSTSAYLSPPPLSYSSHLTSTSISPPPLTSHLHLHPHRTSQGVNRCAFNPGNSLGHAAFNTGVTYFRPSTEAKAFAAAWRNRLLSVEKSVSDVKLASILVLANALLQMLCCSVADA